MRIEKIYSNKEPTNLLHIVVHREKDSKIGRVDITPIEEYLQIASLEFNSKKTFQPHKHILCSRTLDYIQESWVVITGRVKAFLYDLDNKLIKEEILNPGDLSLTFRGGHTYEFLDDNTFVYEFKIGPYYGQEKDFERFIGINND